MKTGFICSSGFNLVATATRDNRQLIAVVLGAPTSAARAQKAAELLESGFARSPFAWLLPAFGNVNALTPIEAAPPDLKDDMCGPHRKRHALEAAMADSADPDAGEGSESAGGNTNSQKSQPHPPPPRAGAKDLTERARTGHAGRCLYRTDAHARADRRARRSARVRTQQKESQTEGRSQKRRG